jgi:heme A synthase
VVAAVTFLIVIIWMIFLILAALDTLNASNFQTNSNVRSAYNLLIISVGFSLAVFFAALIIGSAVIYTSSYLDPLVLPNPNVQRIAYYTIIIVVIIVMLVMIFTLVAIFNVFNTGITDPSLEGATRNSAIALVAGFLLLLALGFLTYVYQGYWMVVIEKPVVKEIPVRALTEEERVNEYF